MKTHPGSITAIIATYNERENILSIVQDLLGLPVELSVMIVDDRSPDGTGELIENEYRGNPRVTLLQREKKMGYGTAMVAGFHRALNDGFQTIITLDADYSHDPAAVPSLIEALEEGTLVIGSRYKDGVRVLNWPPRRLLLSLFANRYVRWALGLDIMDCTSGFRAYDRQVLEKIDLPSLQSQGYSFLVEVLYRATLLGFRVKEAPIVFTERREGQSKMSRRVIFESVIAPWKLRLSKGKLLKGLKRLNNHAS